MSKPKNRIPIFSKRLPMARHLSALSFAPLLGLHGCGAGGGNSDGDDPDTVATT